MSNYSEKSTVLASSSMCACCKRSKTAGPFFKLKYYRKGEESLLDGELMTTICETELLHEHWNADIDVFRQASEAGCQRCAIAFEMACAWRRENRENEWQAITVSNRADVESMVTDVKVYLSKKFGSLPGVGLELLSANHRSPTGVLETVKAQFNLVTKPLSYEDPTSDDALQGTIESLEHCLVHHKYCSNSLSKLPKRFLELNQTTMILRDATSCHPAERYACLSHCWGTEGPSLRLIPKTESDLRQGIAIDSLPRTFAEAAKVCLKLGIRILWIDALCIIQGDEADWKEAAANMAGIYENALVTIAATCAGDSNDGLRPYKHRFRPSRLGDPNFYVRDDRRDEIYFGGGGGPWPLMSRAWVFQEFQLSSRLLCFGSHQVHWTCQTTRMHRQEQRLGHCLDSHAIDLLPFLPGNFRSAINSEDAWHHTVEQYSRMKLTYQSDILPAIAALAQRMAILRPKDTYLAGMWRNTLLSDLQWETISNAPRWSTTLPTWSWASNSAWVDYQSQHTLDRVEIVGLEYTPVGSANIGDIKDAKVTIRGPVLPLQVWYNTAEFLNPPADLVVPRMLCRFESLSARGNESFLAFFMWIGDDFMLNGLILRQIGDVYERIGSFHIEERYLPVTGNSLTEQIASLPLETVCIV